MLSPFPGMDLCPEDPVLWPDLHHSLITYIRDALQPALRPRYNATIGERLISPDVPTGVLAVAEPDRNPQPDEQDARRRSRLVPSQPERSVVAPGQSGGNRLAAGPGAA